MGKVILLLVVLLLTGIIAGTSLGSTSISFLQVIKVFLHSWGLGSQWSFPNGEEVIVFLIRLPRVLIAVLVGAALGLAGAVMQGMFRNPMADPGVIGVSSGASLGAVIAIALGLNAKSLYYLPLFAATGALGAALLVFCLAGRKGKIPVLSLILSGIAVSTFIGAFTSLVLSFAYEYQLKQFLFWTMGGLDDRRWEHVDLVFWPLLIGITVLMLFAQELNILLLGEEEAQSLGINPAKTRIKLLLLASITTALAVSVTGTIGFIGLIVPHVMRLLVGPDHRILLPASALGGSVFLVFCDLIARTAFPLGEIRVGIVTAIVGAPYFLYLLSKAKKEGEAI